MGLFALLTHDSHVCVLSSKESTTVEWIYLLESTLTVEEVKRDLCLCVKAFFPLFFQFILVYLIGYNAQSWKISHEFLYTQHLIFVLDIFFPVFCHRLGFEAHQVFIQSLIKWCIIISGGRLGTWMNYPSMNFHRSQVHFFLVSKKKPGLLLAIIAFL